MLLEPRAFLDRLLSGSRQPPHLISCAIVAVDNRDAGAKLVSLILCQRIHAAMMKDRNKRYGRACCPVRHMPLGKRHGVALLGSTVAALAEFGQGF